MTRVELEAKVINEGFERLIGSQPGYGGSRWPLEQSQHQQSLSPIAMALIAPSGQEESHEGLFQPEQKLVNSIFRQALLKG